MATGMELLRNLADSARRDREYQERVITRKAIMQRLLGEEYPDLEILEDRTEPAPLTGLRPWDALYILQISGTDNSFPVIERATLQGEELKHDIKRQIDAIRRAP